MVEGVGLTAGGILGRAGDRNGGGLRHHCYGRCGGVHRCPAGSRLVSLGLQRIAVEGHRVAHCQRIARAFCPVDEYIVQIPLVGLGRRAGKGGREGAGFTS
ncbi:hypothetical protein SDC9_85819 [bioreactor metagenome]|uniref:Uncharacterized protein n=1 Tax=bioreactor metagenome TaxID=1076179 RepID=A0A644ZEA1_9ZZZZ